MIKRVNETKRRVLKRVCLALVVLLLASAAMVGAGSAESTNTMYVEDSDALKTAIQNVGPNVPTTLVLAKGMYTFPTTDVSMNGKIITFFNDTKEVTIDMTNVQEANQFVTGATLTFDGVTVNWKKQNTGYHGLANAKKVVYKDCTITGTQFMGGDADFIDCTFESGKNTDGTDYDGYCVYGRASGDLTFIDCIFNTGGRAIMLYQDQTTKVNVTLTNCKFYDNGAYFKNENKRKAVVETGDGESKTSVFTITFNGCTVEGFGENNSDSALWGNKNSMPDDRLCVVFVEMDDITLGTNKEYDGKAPTYTGKAVFTRHHVDKSTSTFADTDVNYKWHEINTGEVSNDVGEYQLRASVTYANGYTASIVKEGTVTISPATLTLTIDEGQSKAVGVTPDPALTYFSMGNASGETPKVTGDLTRVAGERAGTYLISFGTMTLDNNGAFLAKNYVLEQSTEPVYFTITPSVVIRGDNVPADHALTEEAVSQTDMDTLNSTIETSYADKFSAGKYFINVSLFDAQGQKASNSINFIIPYDALDISGDAGQYEFVVLHLLANGNVEEITAEDVPEGLKIGPTTTSPFVIGYSVKQTPPPKDTSSHSQGSSVWLTETPTPTTTETVQPTETVPTDISTPEPTETPASPAFGVLAVLAGLGAVAALRRK